MSSEMKFAVLIDGDNIAPKYLKAILDEVSDHGVATYKRIYSDWTDRIRASWKQPILEHSVLPVQQYSYTTGKNATDSAMIIDAMDILYTGNVDGFYLVTSDSDFTRLAARLREAGKEVIGIGEAKTPKAFRSACNSFKLLEVIYNDEDEKGNGSQKGNSLKVTDLKEIENAICKIIDENSNKGKDTYIGEVGSKLTNKYPDFDVRNYGCTKLSTLLEDKMNNFILQKKNTSTIIMIKSTDITREDIEQQIVRILREHNGKCNNMAIINEGLKAWNSAFSAKKLGYSKFSDYLQSFPELLEVKNNEVRLLIK
ncbi:MAG: NYN domain-containing protein [Lachnospiraceae bacterium]